MFTGIIEALGRVRAKETAGTNCIFTIESGIASELKVDQSVSHNGVCLTVSALLEADLYQVVAVEETLIKSNLADLDIDSLVNLERSMVLGGRLDGHLVQGHVDTKGNCSAIADQDGSWSFSFDFQTHPHHMVVEKGSICVNGVSLTCFNTTDSTFEVAVIPYTFEHTNFSQLKVGEQVNLEFDIIGKYLQRLMEKRD